MLLVPPASSGSSLRFTTHSKHAWKVGAPSDPGEQSIELAALLQPIEASWSGNGSRSLAARLAENERTTEEDRIRSEPGLSDRAL